MEDLKFLDKCHFCGKKYNKKKIEIIEKYEHLSVVYTKPIEVEPHSFMRDQVF